MRRNIILIGKATVSCSLRNTPATNESTQSYSQAAINFADLSLKLPFKKGKGPLGALLQKPSLAQWPKGREQAASNSDIDDIFIDVVQGQDEA